jgi:ParB family chromosome partitioning protein
VFDQAARIDAAAALGRTGGSEAVAALRALAFDKKGTPEALRKAAYRAFKRAERQAGKQKKYEAQK